VGGNAMFELGMDGEFEHGEPVRWEMLKNNSWNSHGANFILLRLPSNKSLGNCWFGGKTSWKPRNKNSESE